MAQCSESTGTSSAPGVARARCTTGPPAIRLSLLASPRRLPALRVASVTPKPAKPTTPLITTSATAAAASNASGPTSRSTPTGSSPASSPERLASVSTTTSGRTAAAWAATASTDPWALSEATRNRSGSVAMTSRVWVPIEPVEPSTATLIMRALPELDRSCGLCPYQPVTVTKYATGSTNSSASKRSSTPPWDGSTVPMSLT